MNRLIAFLHRHEPHGETLAHFKSGVGAAVGIAVVGALAAWTGLPLLLAPFGASAVLLFGQPASPLAQPANVLGGYLIAALLSAVAFSVLPATWWIAALAVGVVIGLMLALRVTHPPAGAIPLVAFSSHLPATTLVEVTMLGAACLVALAVLHHWLPPRSIYPRVPVKPQPVRTEG